MGKWVLHQQRKPKYCKRCGEKIKNPRLGKVFCSTECGRKARAEEKVGKIKHGLISLRNIKISVMELENIYFEYEKKREKFVCKICKKNWNEFATEKLLIKHYKKHQKGGDLVMTENTLEQKIKDRKAFQVRVLRRFMTEEQIKTLLEGYNENVHMGGYYKDRDQILSTPLSTLDKAILKEYYFSMEKSVKSIAIEKRLKIAKVDSIVKGASTRLLYQNREKINLEELLRE